MEIHHRTERLAESLRVELEEILNYELSDPRVTTVAVTEVQLSPDHKKAHVRLALAGTEAEQAACMEAVENAKGYVKRLVADRIDIFRLPDLYFDPDLDPSVRDKVSSLLRRVKRGRPRG
ncbi:MAG: 30S ribosome-binding factor RbfA [Bryobacterales bacterium]|nr:30S ribosome-binding factor RbfA [Bryobacterales bacterium]